MKNSPFTFFRKYQRVGMVILTVTAMFAFVFLDTTFSGRGGGGSVRADQIAVKIAGGNLTESALQQLRMERGAINEFIARIIVAVATADEKEKLNDQQLNQRVRMNQFGIEWMQLAGDLQGEQNLVWGHIMRLEARRLGLVVTDPMVTSHITRMTDNKLTPEQFRDALTGTNLREKQVYDMFREELLARNAWMIARPLIDPTPEQYWEYYRRMKVRQNLEVAALPVSEFAKQIQDPTDAVLESFFNKYKHRFAGQGPHYSLPGFRQPDKVRVQYLTANYEDVEKTTAAITDKDVEEFYEKNKNTLYREQEKPEAPAGDDTPLNPELAPDKPEAPALPESNQPQPSAPAKDAADKPAADKPAADKPADEKKAEPKSEEPKAEEKPDAKPNEKAEEKKSEKSCGEEPAAKDAAAEDKPAADEKPAEEKPAEEKPAEKKPAEDKSATDKPATEKPATEKPAESKPAAPATGEKSDKPAPAADPAKPAGDAPALEKPEATPVKFKPLTDELKDNIREELLRQRTQEALKKLRDEALNLLDGRNLKYNMPISVDDHTAYYDFNEDGKLDSDEPSVVSETKLNPDEINKIPAEVTAELKQKLVSIAAGDLQSVGKKLGMKYSASELISGKEIDEMPGLGKVIDEGDNPFQPTSGGGILNQLFGREQLFNPASGKDSETQDLYVYWKAEQVASHIPKFTDPGIKTLVSTAWKLSEAYPIAEKRATELAKLAGNKQKLEVALKGQTVTNGQNGLPVLVHETADFTWMTPATPSPNMWDSQPPSLSTVAFVENADEEFMQVAFDELAIGDSGVAPNRDHSVVYVIRVINREPKPGEETSRMRETFMKERLFGIIPGLIPSAYSHIASQEEARLRFDWMEALKKKYDVTFTDEEKNF